MTNLLTTFLTLVALGLSFPLERAWAQEDGNKTKADVTALLSAHPNASPAETLKSVQEYLNGLKRVKARFLQTAPDGSQFLGTFYLDRPGKLRFEYDPPVKDFVVADGLFIYFYDGPLGEQTNAPIGQTLADFLLRKTIDFSDDLKVKDVQRSGGLLRVTLAQSKDEAAGTLTLGFTEGPLTLKKWRITDATGAITEIELAQLETDMKLADGLFVYRDPKILPGRVNQ